MRDLSSDEESLPAPKKLDISQIQPSTIQIKPVKKAEPQLKGYVMKKSSKSRLISLWQRRFLVY